MFSIIMPTYNCEKYVLSAVQSVLSQTYRNFELIIVDDTSSDSTFQVLKDISLTDKRIRLYQIPHAGVSAARNYGIEQAQGENILFPRSGWPEAAARWHRTGPHSQIVLHAVAGAYLR